MWNPIEEIVPKTNKWYLVKTTPKITYTSAPYVAISWTGTQWFDGYMFYRDLTSFGGWRYID